MKKQVLFLHSAGRQSLNEGSGRLVNYLQRTLGKEYEVLYPEMPDPENPRYLLWKLKLEKILGELDGEVILVGHSLGGSVLLKYLSEQTYKKPILALFLMAVPYWGENGWEIDEFILTHDFESRLPRIQQIFLYHSMEDEWVPFAHMNQYAKKFPQAIVRIVEGGEHEFYYGLPELVNDIKSVIRNGNI